MPKLASRAETLRLAVLVALLVLGGSVIGQAAQIPTTPMLSVTPELATPGDPLLVTVTGEANANQCPRMLGPTIGNGFVTIPYSTGCFMPPLSVGPFTIERLVGPLNPGDWELRLFDIDQEPPTVVDSVTVTVLDPRYSIRVEPSPAAENDVLTAHVTGLGSCPFLDSPEIEPGRIRINIHEFGICDPPPPVQYFATEQGLGELDVGDYVVQLLYRGSQQVAETTLSVQPAGSCVSGETVLCLNNGRFRVQATWTTRMGETGLARAVEETEDSGLFWFFNEENIEMVVKVIDACHTGFDSFWFFAGGLTDVGLVIEVTDTQSGQTMVYENPLGEPFDAITDIAAFMTCP